MTRWNRLNKKQAKKLGIEQVKNKEFKYKNKKSEVDGIVFDSKKEAAYYINLKLARKAGKIKDFHLQPVFELLEPKKDFVTGKGIYYRADFKVIKNDGSEEIVDTKGYKTYAYKLKKKLLLAKYPDLNFKEV